MPVAAWGPVSGALGRNDPAYRAAGAGAGFVVRNPRQRLRAEFSSPGVSVRSGQALLGLRLSGYGYGGSLRGLAAVAPTASANRVLYRHGSLSEWYANGPLGLEQGFTLAARPAGRRVGPLTLALALSGNARAVLHAFWWGHVLASRQLAVLPRAGRDRRARADAACVGPAAWG